METKSLEPQPMIIPGEYDGLWSAYYVKFQFLNGNWSEDIKLNNGVRVVNCKCIVKEDGYVYVE